MGIQWRWGLGGGVPWSWISPVHPHFRNNPMPLPTFQCPADLVHCKAMLPPSYTREEHDSLSPDSALPLILKSGLGRVRTQMGSRCAWARSKVQLWPLHFLSLPSVTNVISFASFLSPSQNSPILGLIASESHSLLVYLLTVETCQRVNVPPWQVPRCSA